MEHIGFAARYAHNDFSQNGEDGIIAECLRRMVIGQGWVVEVGANDGRWCSNTARLIDLGFSATLIEADPDLFRKCQAEWAGNDKVECVNERVGRENINRFVWDNCVVFSTDTDGPDFQSFRRSSALLALRSWRLTAASRPRGSHLTRRAQPATGRWWS